MSGKRLLPLAAVLVVLVAVALMVKRQPTPTRLMDQVGWERLVPDTLRAESITGVDIYQGRMPDQVLSLRRQGEGWQVVTYFDAPVRPSRIETLLEHIGGLEGELRADREELVAEFDLEEEQALHLLVYTGDAEEPALHLLAGRGGRRSGFVRLVGDSRVYNVDLNLHSMAGLWGENLGSPPAAETWLQLRLNEIRSENVAAVELDSPRGHFRFARVGPEDAEGGEGAAEEQGSWRSEVPDVDYEVNQQLLNRLAVALGNLRADDVADGSDAAAYGLEDSVYRAVLTVQMGGEPERQVRMQFGNEVPGADMDGARYAVQEGDETVYVVPGWSFRQLFPKGKTLLNLPGLQLAKDDMQQIALYSADNTVRLSRLGAAEEAEGDESPEWQMDEPSLGFPVNQDGVDAWVEFLSGFVPDGMAPENGAAVAAADSVPRVEITMQDASRHQIRLADASGDAAGQVVYVSGQDWPFVIEEDTRDELLPSLGTLMDLPLLPIQPDNVIGLNWQQGDGSWTLARMADAEADPETPAQWQFPEAPEKPVNAPAISELLVITASLVADDWLGNPPAAALDDPLLVITLTRVDGARARATVGPLLTDSSAHLVRFEGAPGMFVLPSDAYGKLTEALAKVLSDEPAAEAPAEP
ncbi:MAG: DUF4340 domain-containing protein [Candidatus Tectomicrobia bacterium]|nr:DUF4340 domain-containing protein [Candidatus Tectomicrobia bacterium]